MSETWNEPDDARIGGNDYPNYHLYKSPSGHVINLDDTKDKESVTVQHRSGSMIQMHPNGDVVIKAHGAQYNIVIGDNKVMITGSHDVTINGGGSLKVQGDYDVTVHGDMNLAVSGNMNHVVNGNLNTMIKGNQDTVVDGSQTTKVAENTEHTSEGKVHLAGHDALYLESTGGAAELNADSGIRIRADSDIDMESNSIVNIDGEQIHLNG